MSYGECQRTWPPRKARLNLYHIKRSQKRESATESAAQGGARGPRTQRGGREARVPSGRGERPAHPAGGARVPRTQRGGGGGDGGARYRGAAGGRSVRPWVDEQGGKSPGPREGAPFFMECRTRRRNSASPGKSAPGRNWSCAPGAGAGRPPAARPRVPGRPAGGSSRSSRPG